MAATQFSRSDRSSRHAARVDKSASPDHLAVIDAETSIDEIKRKTAEAKLLNAVEKRVLMRKELELAQLRLTIAEEELKAVRAKN